MSESGGEATPKKRNATFLQNDQSAYVKLNVGGFLFQTTVTTLTKFDTMFRAMFSGRMEVTKDSEGWILIDRNGDHFGIILKYLRDGSVSLPNKIKDLKDLLAEARYYLIKGLVDLCESRLERLKADPCGQVRMFSSPAKEAEFILHSKRPIVKLSTSRSISKQPLANALELNLLKNRDLFGRLCLKCSSRIIFIQDEQKDDSVCCWSFYNNGKQISSIDCIYFDPSLERWMDGSDSINTTYLPTRVDFPETKIYEEVHNLTMQAFNISDDDSCDG